MGKLLSTQRDHDVALLLVTTAYAAFVVSALRKARQADGVNDPGFRPSKLEGRTGVAVTLTAPDTATATSRNRSHLAVQIILALLLVAFLFGGSWFYHHAEQELVGRVFSLLLALAALLVGVVPEKNARQRARFFGIVAERSPVAWIAIVLGILGIIDVLDPTIRALGQGAMWR